jgi:hypothetical protein
MEGNLCVVSKAKIYSEIYSLVDIILIQGRQHNHDIIMGCTLYTVLIQCIRTVDSQEMQFAITSGTDICPVFKEHY